MILQEVFAPVDEMKPLSKEQMDDMDKARESDDFVLPELEKPEPGFFDGMGEASWKGVASGALKSASAFDTALSSTGMVRAALQNAEVETGYAFEDIDQRTSAIENRLNQDSKELRRRAKEDYGVNPETMGTAAQIVYGVAETIPKAIGYSLLAGPAGGSVLFGADLGISRTQELMDEGVDQNTAINAGLVTFGAAALGMRLPSTFGRSRIASATIGAAANAGLTAAEMQGVNWVLQNQNYSELAQKYQLNAVDLAVSGIFGGVMGGVLWRPGMNNGRPQTAQERSVALQEKIKRQLREASPEHLTDEQIDYQARVHATGIQVMADRAQIDADAIAPEIVRGDASEGLNQIIGLRGSENLRESGSDITYQWVAESMETQGKSVEAIRLATGWERGADGQWRYEIPDIQIKENAFRVIREADAARDAEQAALWERTDLSDDEYVDRDVAIAEKYENQTLTTKLEDVVDAPELFRAYPQLKELKVEFGRLSGNARGYYAPGSKTIRLPRRADILQNATRSTLAHEIQHAIQDIEGFASGASPELMMPKDLVIWRDMERLRIYRQSESWQQYVRLRDEIFDSEDPSARLAELGQFEQNSDVQEVLKELNRLREKWGYDENISRALNSDDWLPGGEVGTTLNEADPDFQLRQYYRVAGEVEARNVQDRLDMTDEQRRQTTLEATESYPRVEQIITITDTQSISASYSAKDVEKAKPLFKKIVDRVLEGKSTHGQGKDSFADYLPVSKAESDILKQHGVDVEGYTHTVVDSDLLHAINRHGEGNETRIDQIPLTAKELERIPEVISSPDLIGLGVRTKVTDLQTVVSKKTMEDGVTYVVEEIRTGRKKLAFHTAYKRITPTPGYSYEPPALRPERSGVNSSIDIVSQNANNVNEFVPDTDLIQKAKDNFGVTKDLREAFYVLPDGTILDGSGRHWGGSELDVAGQRQVDHGDIGEIIDDATTAADAMYKWMARSGAMRFDQIVGIASIARKPTPQQLAVLSRASRGKYLALSFNTPEGRIVDDIEFERASPVAIRHFFESAQVKAANGIAGAFAQRAWHGSPHIFDTFSTEHIGTGEGAQAHGWGLYFAADRGVAERYKNVLTDRSASINSVLDELGSSEVDVFSRYIDLDDYETFSREIERGAFSPKTNELLRALEENDWLGYDSPVRAIRQALSPSLSNYEHTPRLDRAVEAFDGEGRVFEVEIPDEAKMLDEQASFANQPEDVKRAIRKLLPDIQERKTLLDTASETVIDRDLLVANNAYRFDRAFQNLKDYVSGNYDEILRPGYSPRGYDQIIDELVGTMRNNGDFVSFVRVLHPDWSLESAQRLVDGIGNSPRAVADWLARDLAKMAQQDAISPAYLPGRELYRELSRRLGGDRNASLALKDEGVEGISYEGARDGRSYVVFDDNAIQTIEYYQRRMQEHGATRGSFDPARNRITLTPNANISTYSHEMGHWYLENLFQLSRLANAESTLKEDANTLLREFGVKSIDDWDALGIDGQRQFHEQFASWVEIYLSEGRAPKPTLQRVFERLGQWLVDLYRELGGVKKAVGDTYKAETGNDLPPVSEEVGKVLDRLFANDRAVRKASQVSKAQVAAARMVQANRTNNDKLEEILTMPNGKEKTRALRDLEKSANAQLKAIQAVRRGLPVDVSQEVEQMDVDTDHLVEMKGNFGRAYMMGNNDSAVILQNRDRSDVGSIGQMNAIAANPQYGLVSVSRSYSGAPVVSYGSVPDSAHLGNNDFIVETNGNRVPFMYAVVEADDVETSNFIDGSTNAGYGNPQRMNAVIGNGRMTALKEAYSRGTADQYRTDLEADAAHGINSDVIHQMKNPVLVRVINPEDVTSGLISRSNGQQVLALDDVEVAREDAPKIRARAGQYEFDEAGNPTNDTLALFIQDLHDPNALGRLITSDGRPTPEAVRRIRNAVFFEAYQSPELSALFSQEVDPGIRRILNGMANVAPRIIELREQAQQLDFSNLLVEAANRIRQARLNPDEGVDFASQTSFLDNPASAAFVEFLNDNANSAAAIARTLNPLIDWAENAAQAADGGLFGGDAEVHVDLADVVGQLRNIINDQRAEAGLDPLPEIDIESMRDQIQSSVAMVAETVDEVNARIEAETAQAEADLATQAEAIEAQRQQSLAVLDEKTSLDARAQFLMQQNPDQIYRVLDENGMEVQGTIGDLLAQADADVQRAQVEAAGIGRAVECVLRNGGI